MKEARWKWERGNGVTGGWIRGSRRNEVRKERDERSRGSMGGGKGDDEAGKKIRTGLRERYGRRRGGGGGE